MEEARQHPALAASARRAARPGRAIAAAPGAALLALLLALPAAAQEAPRLFDVIVEPEAGIARFRFVLPGLADFATVEAELPRLCAEVALPEIAAEGWVVESVVISVADRELPFGEVDPEAVQFFDGYTVADGTCVWTPF